MGHVLFSKVGNISKKRGVGCDNCSEYIYIPAEAVKVTYTAPNGKKYSARCHNKQCAEDWADNMKEQLG